MEWPRSRRDCGHTGGEAPEWGSEPAAGKPSLQPDSHGTSAAGGRNDGVLDLPFLSCSGHRASEEVLVSKRSTLVIPGYQVSNF